MKSDDLIRMRDALANLSDATDYDAADVPTQWARNNDGTWTPVFSDGRTGGEFTWAQMLAARGEDIGEVLESLIAAGLITNVQAVGIDVLDQGRG
ncbi:MULTISPECIES: hypothetical protein [Nocardia]|uniref:hypothetical protein n=1 Tax=Nocardia TaxID=1817 RepID=UPI0007A3A48C|nr:MULTISPECIES: hypothetical protein [Nocardia]